MPHIIAGVDEVGRGPLAGPVTAAAVILDERKPIANIQDSKKISSRKRQELALIIQKRALAWSIGWASVTEIDKYNILQATFLAMQRAVQDLTITPQLIRVDGNQKPDFGDIVTETIIGGDAIVDSIGAASILAKTARDTLMQHWHHLYPHYGFDRNKGYPSKQHKYALQKHGISIIHRRSFKPCRQYSTNESFAYQH